MEIKQKENRFNLESLTLVLVVILLVISVIQSFQIISTRNYMMGNSMMSDSEGETYEEMTARMHPEATKDVRASSSPGMVGGC